MSWRNLLSSRLGGFCGGPKLSRCGKDENPALLIFATRSATNSVLKDMEIISWAIHLYAAIYWSIGIIVLVGCIIVGCIIAGIIWVLDKLTRQNPPTPERETTRRPSRVTATALLESGTGSSGDPIKRRVSANQHFRSFWGLASDRRL